MSDHRSRFLQLALNADALRFGQFTLKSGRVSPYFFNAGRFDTGLALAQLGNCYADAVESSGVAFDQLFGPAYKGIPLGAVTAVALAQKGVDKPFCYNRKEAKDHGEGGTLVGAPLKGKVLIIDDVITAGTAVREVMQIINAQGAEPAGVVIGLNRQEKASDESELSAIQQVEKEYAIPVIGIVELDDIISYLKDQAASEELLQRIIDYRQRYGVGSKG